MRSLTCDRTGCENGALWKVGIALLPLWGRVDRPLELLFSLNVCQFHHDTLQVEDVITEETWDNICFELEARGLATPSRASAKLCFEGVG